MVVCDQHPHRAQSRSGLQLGVRDRSRTVVPVPGPRLDRQLGADQQRPLPHPGDSEAALGLLEGEAAAVVGDLQLDAARRSRRSAHRDPLGAACGGRRWRAPPGRPGRRPAARRRRGRRSRPRSLSSASISRARDLLDLAGDRRRQAEVVERRRPQLAGEREQLPHRLVGERLGLGELRLELRRRRLAHRLEPQQQAGQRLVDLVVEVAGDPRPLLLLGAQGGRPGAPPLGFEAPHHAQEGELDPLDLLGLADAVDRGAAGAGPAGSGRPSPSPRSGSPAARSGAACSTQVGGERERRRRRARRSRRQGHRPS